MALNAMQLNVPVEGTESKTDGNMYAQSLADLRYHAKELTKLHDGIATLVRMGVIDYDTAIKLARSVRISVKRV